MSKKQAAAAPDITPAPISFALAEQFKPRESVVVEIKDPFGEPTPIKIHLAGRYTKAFKAAVALASEQSGDEAGGTERILNLIVAATTAWEGVLDAEGKALPCEAHIVRALYTHDSIPYVITQVTQAFTDASRFFESAKAS